MSWVSVAVNCILTWKKSDYFMLCRSIKYNRASVLDSLWCVWGGGYIIMYTGVLCILYRWTHLSLGSREWLKVSKHACATTYLHSSSPIKRYGSIAGLSIDVYAEDLSNNILLDDALNADLGFMMTLPIDYGSSCIVTSAGAIGMAGTRGYLAPEYGAGKVGPKCDVFSFGIASDMGRFCQDM